MACLSDLGIVRKNRHILRYFIQRDIRLLDVTIYFYILTSVLSLRVPSHEFPGFLKKIIHGAK